MVISQAINNFAGGELTKKLLGRSDLLLYKTGLKICQNWLVDLQGGARFAPGSVYTVHTRQNKKAVFIPFRYSDALSYLLEFTDQKLRFHKNFGLVLETAKNITGITGADPCVVTSAGHGFVTGDEVYAQSITGMTELNGKFFTVGATEANTIALKDVDGVDIDSSAFTAYVSGGTIARVYEVTSPYAEADLYRLKTAQKADLMYIVHPSYAPYKLTRAGDASWTLATFSRTADPFTGANKYPSAVAFYGGRLIYGGTNEDPDTIWGSKTPKTDGTRQYDDMTTGTAAGDGFVYPISPATSQAERIRWLAGTSKFLAIGGYGAIYRADGGASGATITPTAVSVRPLSYYGVEDIPPVFIGETLFYLRRGGRIIDSFSYSFISDDYAAKDLNLANDEITEGGIIQLAEARGHPDLIWGVRSDGVLLALTNKSSEEISAWQRRILGDGGKVLSVGAIPRENAFDITWCVVERTVDGHTRRYVEYFAADEALPEREDYFTGDEEADQEQFDNLFYEAQKRIVRLDSALSVTGETAYGITAGALTGTTAVFTASTSAFVAGDIGRRIVKKYVTGTESGEAEIVEYLSATQVVGKFLEDFSTTAFAAGDWYLSFDTLRGLDHLEGKTVGVLADGVVVNDLTVTDGVAVLPRQATVAVVGLPYKGILSPMDIDIGGMNGPAQTKIKHIVEVGVKVRHTAGIQIGTGLYSLLSAPQVFSVEADMTDRPPILKTGEFRWSIDDASQQDKGVFILQEQPLPAMVLSIVPYVDTTNE